MHLFMYLAPKLAILLVFVLCAVYVHFRGKVRHKFVRQLTDHSTFMAPYNSLVYLCSAVPNTPILNLADFPDLAPLRDNWQTIRDEALQLYEGGHIQSSSKHNDLAFNTFFKRGWKRFYLKWYDDFMPSAKEICPKTVELVQQIPSIHAALFALLPAKSKLGEHRDPFAGSLRYHLGLKTPNSDNCRIYVDGNPYAWRDGEAVIFDETYIHSVNNDTEESRLILFCDVDRPIRNPIMKRVNHFVANHIVKVTQAQNVDTEKVGVLNKLSSGIYGLREFFQSIKKMNRRAYYAMKYALMAGIVYLILLRGMPISDQLRSQLVHLTIWGAGIAIVIWVIVAAIRSARWRETKAIAPVQPEVQPVAGEPATK
jgi:beta-hydroxylase